MKKVLFCSSVSAIDHAAMKDYGMSESVLIENAAIHFVSALKFSPETDVLVLCGRGNNGADGYAIARQLRNNGCTRVCCRQIYENPGAECTRQLEMAKAFGVEILQGLPAEVSPAAMVIDALYGTGFHLPLDDKARAVFRLLDKHPNVISVDIPSGLSDTTPMDSPCVKARFTITFAAPKPCMLTPYQSSSVSTGPEPMVKNPCFPAVLMDKADDRISLVGENDNSLKPLDVSDFKNKRGHVAFFAGCNRLSGAANLCALAAFGARAGLVSILQKPGEPQSYDFPQLMHGSYGDEPGSFQAVGYGNGIDVEDPDSLFQLDRILSADVPTVLDGGALRLLPGCSIECLKNRRQPLILTPHLGELKSVLGKGELEKLSAEEFARLLRSKACEINAVIVAKSQNTWIVSPDGQIRIVWGNLPSLGVAGSGDVLAGIITAFLGAGQGSSEAALNGVLVHLKAGRLASGERGWFDSMGLIGFVGRAVEALTQGGSK